MAGKRESTPKTIVLVHGGGAISLYTDHACSFVNTTFSGKRQRATSGFGGGALYAENFDPAATFLVSVTHCTFAGNEAAAELGTPSRRMRSARK